MGIQTGLNRYTYVDNNPLRYSDPLGLFKVRAQITVVWPTGARDYPLNEPIHENILRNAFSRFNWRYSLSNPGRPVPFSDHTIELFVNENVKTDLIFDDDHQFSYTNHFDQPGDGRIELGATGGTWTASWVKDTIKALDVKRNAYFGKLGRPDLCSQEGDQAIDKKVWEPDITDILRSFGQNTHTLSDFYAHSNWVDPPTKFGTIYPDQLAGKSLTVKGLGQTRLWDEKTFDGVYTGTAEGCDSFDCAMQAIIDGRLPFGSDGGKYYYNVEGGTSDAMTHAFWAKDDDEHAGFQQARELATEHLVLEIDRLWKAAEASGDLREIYGMTKDQKDQRRVKFQTGEFCRYCPY